MTEEGTGMQERKKLRTPSLAEPGCMNEWAPEGGLLCQDGVLCSVPVPLFLQLLVISKGFQRWCLAQSGQSLTYSEDRSRAWLSSKHTDKCSLPMHGLTESSKYCWGMSAGPSCPHLQVRRPRHKMVHTMSKMADLRPKPRSYWLPGSFNSCAISQIKCLLLSEIRLDPPTHKTVQALFVAPHAYLYRQGIEIQRLLHRFLQGYGHLPSKGPDYPASYPSA